MRDVIAAGNAFARAIRAATERLTILLEGD